MNMDNVVSLYEYAEGYAGGELPDMDDMRTFFENFPPVSGIRLSSVKKVGSVLVDYLEENGQGLYMYQYWDLAELSGLSRPTVRKVIALLISLDILELANPEYVGYMSSDPCYWLRHSFIVAQVLDTISMNNE